MSFKEDKTCPCDYLDDIQINFLIRALSNLPVGSFSKAVKNGFRSVTIRANSVDPTTAEGVRQSIKLLPFWRQKTTD